MALTARRVTKHPQNATEVLELAATQVWGSRTERPFNTALTARLTVRVLHDMPSGTDPEAAARAATLIVTDPALNPVREWLEAGGIVSLTRLVATAAVTARRNGLSADDFLELVDQDLNP